MKIKKVYVEKICPGMILRDLDIISNEMIKRNVPVYVFGSMFNDRSIESIKIFLNKETLVCGSIATVHKALECIGVRPPVMHDYDQYLYEYYKRRIWIDSLGNVLDYDYPIFVKPAKKIKKFNGMVIDSDASKERLQRLSNDELIWCSELVNWVSEWRYFVSNGEILDSKNYSGDASICPVFDEVKEAVEVLRDFNVKHRTFVIDFGVTISGETCLVELNPGYSVAGYGVGASVYTDVIVNFWNEMMDN